MKMGDVVSKAPLKKKTMESANCLQVGWWCIYTYYCLCTLKH